MLYSLSYSFSAVRSFFYFSTELLPVRTTTDIVRITEGLHHLHIALQEGGPHDGTFAQECEWLTVTFNCLVQHRDATEIYGHLSAEFCPFAKYRVIHKSLRDFRSLRYSSRDGHAEGERVNRGRDTPSFCPTLQVLEMSTLLCLSWLLRSRVQKFRRDL